MSKGNDSRRVWWIFIYLTVRSTVRLGKKEGGDTFCVYSPDYYRVLRWSSVTILHYPLSVRPDPGFWSLCRLVPHWTPASVCLPVRLNDKRWGLVRCLPGVVRARKRSTLTLGRLMVWCVVVSFILPTFSVWLLFVGSFRSTRNTRVPTEQLLFYRFFRLGRSPYVDIFTRVDPSGKQGHPHSDSEKGWVCVAISPALSTAPWRFSPGRLEGVAEWL